MKSGPMDVMVISAKDILTIMDMIKRAHAKPIPWEALKQHMVPNQDSAVTTLADRAVVPARPPSESIELPLGYRLNISCEEQPAGLCLHLSMSEYNALPHPRMVSSLLGLLGFPQAVIDTARVWIEEFLVDGEPGGQCVNVVLVIEPARQA
jgi:hypothetical protein